ncbi:MAG: DJ-1/PfpI family protein [Clostridia bacterium]|nr:DJ-1/PfpI family protein [Clostridia bacterium]
MNCKYLKLFIACLLSLSLVLGGSTGVMACNKKTPKKVVMVIAQKNFEDSELFKPKAILEASGAKVIIASKTTDEAIGMNGAKVKPDIKISDIHANKYDALIVVGGSGSIDTLWEDLDLRSVAQKAYKKCKLVCAICAAPVVLAKAGILDGKQATMYPWDEGIKELEKYGAIYTDQEVVVDGKIITGRNPDASAAFGQKIAQKLGISK